MPEMHVVCPPASGVSSVVYVELWNKVKDDVIDPICWPWTTIADHCSTVSQW